MNALGDGWGRIRVCERWEMFENISIMRMGSQKRKSHMGIDWGKEG